MRFCQSACECDENRAQNNDGVIGSGFCDFLSALLTFRPIRESGRANPLRDHTCGEILSALTGAKKARLQESGWSGGTRPTRRFSGIRDC